MSEDELACEFSRIFRQEWHKAQFWARIKYFTWGIIAASTVWTLALTRLI